MTQSPTAACLRLQAFGQFRQSARDDPNGPKTDGRMPALARAPARMP